MNFFLFIFFFNFIIADSLDEKIIRKAINELYNYKFQNSLILLDSVITINPEHPVPYFLKIANKWLYSQINVGYESSYNVIYNEVEKVIPIYENYINEYPDSAKYYLYLGSSYGLKARVALAKKDWLNVIMFGYLGLQNIKKAEFIESRLNDVYMPIGLMGYFVSISSRYIQWISKFLGINVNKKIAINNLEKSANNSTYSWIESKSVLIYIYLYFENDFFKAHKLAKEMYIKFPGNPYFIYLYAECLIRLQKFDEFYLIMHELKEKPYNYPNIQKNECLLKLNHVLALNHFFKKEYQKSIYYCEWITNNYNMEMDWLLGYAWLMMGKINDIYGNREIAISFYKKVENLDNLFNYISFVEQYIISPYTDLKIDPLFNNSHTK